MASEKIKFSRLEKWVADYENNSLKRETKNVVINLSDIQDLIDYCNGHDQKSKINALRFYFVRQNDLGTNRDIVFDDQTQISLVAVPVLDYTDNEFDADGKLLNPEGGYDVIEKTTDGDEVFAVYPISTNHEHSGLCPYNCKGSINNSINPVP